MADFSKEWSMDMLAARRRGFYPERVAPERPADRVLITIGIDAALYDWLKTFVDQSGNSFTFCVEETIETALRTMRGDLDMLLLAKIAADTRGVPAAAVLFGHCHDENAAQELLVRAYTASRGETP